MTLEQYRDKEAWKNENLWEEVAFTKGFDAAIALDLSVKFTEWKDYNFYIKGVMNNKAEYYPKASSEHYNILNLIRFTPQDTIELKELYQYYITHIYKPE